MACASLWWIYSYSDQTAKVKHEQTCRRNIKDFNILVIVTMQVHEILIYEALPYLALSMEGHFSDFDVVIDPVSKVYNNSDTQKLHRHHKCGDW